jgi:hypothetical protein
MILQASIHRVAPNGILAALALEVDTIPKPDGLEVVKQSLDIERNSNDLEPCSKVTILVRTAFDEHS